MLDLIFMSIYHLLKGIQHLTYLNMRCDKKKKKHSKNISQAPNRALQDHGLMRVLIIMTIHLATLIAG